MIVLTPHWTSKYENFRRQMRLRMHTFAKNATNLTALNETIRQKALISLKRFFYVAKKPRMSTQA